MYPLSTAINFPSSRCHCIMNAKILRLGFSLHENWPLIQTHCPVCTDYNLIVEDWLLSNLVKQKGRTIMCSPQSMESTLICAFWDHFTFLYFNLNETKSRLGIWSNKWCQNMIFNTIFNTSLSSSDRTRMKDQTYLRWFLGSMTKPFLIDWLVSVHVSFSCG